MGKELIEIVKKEVLAGKGVEGIKAELLNQGFLEDEIMEAIQKVKGAERTKDEKKNNALLSVKEVFDRVGYGFANVQFINILFHLTGAGFFLIGIVNGLKAIMSLLISSFLQEYSKVRSVGKKFMSRAGILFGLSFLFIAFAVVIKSVPLFAVALFVGSIGVVTYGDLYNRLVEQTLKKEKMSKFLLRISHYGVLITGISFIISGFLFDKFPMVNAAKIVILGKSFPVYGYLIAFEITAIVFILSGYVLHYVKERKVDTEKIKGFVSTYYHNIREQTKRFVKNKYLVTLLIAGSITGLVQILGNSYYGIFIYKEFFFIGFGGFLNVAVIFTFALIVSFLGPAFSRYLNRKVGLAPSLVFGTLLLAMMPLVAAYNAHFMSISIANALSVLGAAILGMSQGLLVRKLLNESQRKLYFAAMSIAVIIPFLILIPFLSYLAQLFGLVILFKILAIILLILAAPIYFILVIMANKLRL